MIGSTVHVTNHIAGELSQTAHTVVAGYSKIGSVQKSTNEISDVHNIGGACHAETIYVIGFVLDPGHIGHIPLRSCAG